MKFEIGSPYNISDSTLDRFYLEDDSSLLYKSRLDNYSIYNVSLGGNWRIQLIVDSITGQCIKVEIYLDSLIVKYQPLAVPESEKKELYFVTDEIMQQGSGCCYNPFSGEICFDPESKILCLGSHNASGRAVEFARHITAVVDGGDLKCIYLQLDNLPKLEDFLLPAEGRFSPKSRKENLHYEV